MGRSLGMFIGSCCAFLGGVWVLFTLGWVSRFRFSSGYWTWRKQTAFPPNDPLVGKISVLGLTLAYARWAWRIRRLR